VEKENIEHKMTCAGSAGNCIIFLTTVHIDLKRFAVESGSVEFDFFR
jgi:hypothetical protein